LTLFLHEAAHFALHVAENEDRPQHIKERQAYQWAFARMREAGIAVPRAMIKRSKRYVARVKRRGERLKRLQASMATRGKEHLSWHLQLTQDGYYAEAGTLKWRYEVMRDINVEGHWVAHRSFGGHLKDCSLGELWVDTFQTFEETLSRADRWHAERDADYDWEWLDAPIMGKT
jgi:hypothetical protein